MEDYIQLSEDEYRKFCDYILEHNVTNEIKNQLAYGCVYTKEKTFQVKLLNKNNLFLDKILLDIRGH
tara:strand:- start:2357 stop:2557 length:201 start_codon:yes stop_codon:yes gene_type:complete